MSPHHPRPTVPPAASVRSSPLASFRGDALSRALPCSHGTGKSAPSLTSAQDSKSRFIAAIVSRPAASAALPSITAPDATGARATPRVRSRDRPRRGRTSRATFAPVFRAGGRSAPSRRRAGATMTKAATSLERGADLGRSPIRGCTARRNRSSSPAPRALRRGPRRRFAGAGG